ncbi:MAG: arylsulfatase [Verrucomicrobiaceae bacterium]|nr:arylsulfatase [Verrucomicrobiaceae bacterium]
MPNVIFILADDLGYGDVSCFNPQSKVKTPHLDALAAQGMKFTDAHSPTAVCTPTRYALLTGRYSWRTKLARGVLLGFEPPLIAQDRLTLPQQLKGHGYHTAMIGKWHLGWDWPVTKEQLPLLYPKRGQSLDVTDAHRSAWAAFSDARIPGGPIERGFDSYFGVCVPNLPPYGFIRDDRLTASLAEMKKAGDVTDVGRTTTTGPAGAMVEGHRFDQIMPTLVKESVSYLASRAGKAEPFFLYLPLTSPHFPVVPSEAFRGKSGVGDLGDFILETDAAVGSIMKALDEHQLAQNTLLIFTSDNGPAKNSRQPLTDAGHDGSGGLRGHKGTIYEGGHRVPFIARWPGHTPPGSVSDEPITHACMMATMAELLGDKLPPNAAEDSHSILSVLNGQKPEKPTHNIIVHDSGASVFALRWRNWKLIARPDGEFELYDLKTDLAEKTNLAAMQPEKVESMKKLLQAAINRGRTTPGPNQPNDRKVTMNDPKAPLNE